MTGYAISRFRTDGGEAVDDLRIVRSTANNLRMNTGLQAGRGEDVVRSTATRLRNASRPRESMRQERGVLEQLEKCSSTVTRSSITLNQAQVGAALRSPTSTSMS
eukprot:5787766-Amphidinium_carterae.1